MVSGVRPRTTLEKLQIPVLSDLEGIGQNMWVRIELSKGGRYRPRN